MSVVVSVGLCTVDLVQRVGTLPAPGEKVQSSSVELAAGGPAANAAVAVACGVEVTDVLPYRVAPPAVSAVSVRESDGERTVVSHNAAGVAAVADVDLAGAGCLLLDGHHPELALRAARSARDLGVPVVLDAGSWKPVLADLLSYVDVCACSASFAAPEEIPSPVVIRTAGPDPVTWSVGRARGSVDVPPAEVRDTVGAGDVWHGAAALAVARLGRVPSADDLPAVIEFANRAAAVRIGHEGARAWFVPMRQLGA